MRLFIAIELPEEVKSYLKDLQKQILNDKAKLTLANDFHLTLKFLGEVEEQDVDVIKSKLKEIMFEPFAAKLLTIGVFPSEKSIRVVWVGLEPKDLITDLQKKIDSSLQSKFEKDSRFHPHLTLARVKFLKDSKSYSARLKSINVEPKEFTVSNFKLIRSTLTPKGSVYEVLAEFSAIGTVDE